MTKKHVARRFDDRRGLSAPVVARTQTPAPAAPAVELKVGDTAPAFSLPGTDGKTHKLAEYKGKAVVIAWYPAAFTSGCTAECKSFAENGPVLKQFDVAYFMASVDTPEKNKAFAEQEKANFPLLSDPDKTVATAYGVLNARGVARIAGRSTSGRTARSRTSRSR